MSSPVLFEDIFEVLEKDPDGRRFDKVSRFRLHSDVFDVTVVLDVNIGIYQLSVGEKLTLALASSLDGSQDTGHFDPQIYHDGKRPLLLDKFEFIMYGKIFKVTDKKENNLPVQELLISYGGLMMLISGDPKKLSKLCLDEHVYLLIKKVK
eukprot:TRINITY_DN5193_c1_g3_i1.p2 TRINITY_DN5193_c1_g3~~TRINITY_DN5193_c1_g3_i1.p2  ORF type:complete len:151 (-),score=21.81 TRINITY_DN5193_c1_g3_i1:471-923(-)